MKKVKQSIIVKGNQIELLQTQQFDYISLTDIARYKNPHEPKDIIKNWLRAKSTIEFLGIWEQIHNPDFKGVEFDPLQKEAGSNSFVLSPLKWITTVNAKGLIVKSGNAGGTYAHKDIAFEFAAWISAEFKLYLIKEFQRLKEGESSSLQLEWNIHRTISRINNRIHTDAIMETLVPPTINAKQAAMLYASEADVINLAVFGQTSKEWKQLHPTEKGSIRDHANLEQLIILANLESINALLIRNGLTQRERLIQLNQTAIQQMKSLLRNPSLKQLKNSAQ
ncbi:MAG: KilA-N domain-containing protein [Bacteroidota bacterium]